MIKRHIRTPIMHRAVEANGFVFFGGIVADDCTLDMAGQTRQVLEKLEGYLTEAGTDKTRIVSATAYVSDLNLKQGMNEVWTEWFAAEHLPARATLGVGDLGEGALLELVVTAVK
ncbi:RidA family protein [Billgrantia pellis]|uniref:RidA family protein n=1 Tax=Billgrantia pellis TaxID=2606936 RepID=A0A7V7FXC5_9GAMM|nr:RidA family protein [Halomonas pellis]KAA0010410.1 RidA family protein [Halomonas pellis]